MKKLLFVMLVLLTSCGWENPVEISPERGEAITSLQILNNIDSVNQYSIVGNEVYQLREGVVTLKGSITSGTNIAPIPVGWLLLIVVLSVLAGIYILGRKFILK